MIGIGNPHIGQCVFCLKEDVAVLATSTTEEYCIDCYKIVTENCKDAMTLLENYNDKIESMDIELKERIDEQMKRDRKRIDLYESLTEAIELELPLLKSYGEEDRGFGKTYTLLTLSGIYGVPYVAHHDRLPFSTTEKAILYKAKVIGPQTAKNHHSRIVLVDEYSLFSEKRKEALKEKILIGVTSI